ncbi:hypothetical protein C8R44DRAFT_981894 [Mycena epipterygia]|nr:hypothetical protein C8R44DRAFT_981894 [Mycena epipterygia]
MLDHPSVGMRAVSFGDYERSKSKSAQAATRDRISELDNQIESLQTSLAALLYERNQRQEELGAYAYPILTLPNEITSEIFTHFPPAFPARSTPMGPISPLLLSQICRQWRDVAVSTPSLWNAIQLNLDNPDRHQQQLRLLEAWLARSGNCPLSISLERSLDGREDISTAAFVEAIVCHTPRWYDMNVQLPHEELHLIKGPMPLLRTLKFGPTTYSSADDDDTSLVVPFGQAPNLKAAVLSVYFNPFIITLPWAQITTLEASLFDTEAAEILHYAPNLQECRIWLYPSFESDSIAAIPPLVHLRSLHLFNDDPDCCDAEDLFTALTLPSLQTITIFEPLLGRDPVNALSLLCPAHIQRIEVVGACFTSEEDYSAAFRCASVSVENAEEPSDSEWELECEDLDAAAYMRIAAII